MKILKFNESDNTNKGTLLYYSFDWDDNILHMPTEIMTWDDQNEEVGIATSDFATYRNEIGNNPFEYKGHTIVSYPKNEDGSIAFDQAFRNFRDFSSENIFKKDVDKALKMNAQGPAWDDFIECLINGSLFSIITARGHESDTLREGTEFVINTVLTDDQKQEMYNHLLKYVNMFGSKEDQHERLYDESGVFTENELVKSYLDNCDFVGVSAPSRGGTPDNPEKAKEEALMNFKRKVNRFAGNVGLKAKIGFSDDDLGNVKHIEDLFKNLDHEEFAHIIQYVVKNTNDVKNVTKMTHHVVERFSTFKKK